MKNLCSLLLVGALSALPTLSAAEVDDCVIGPWATDLADMEELFEQSNIGGTLEMTGGAATMDISDDGVLSIIVSNVAADMVIDGAGTVQVTWNGTNAGTIRAQDGTFDITIKDFSLVPVIKINGNIMPVPPSETTAQTSSGTYTCSETELLLIGPDMGAGIQAMPRRWTRG